MEFFLKQKKGFWKNKYVNQSGSKAGYRKYEVWNNTLFYINSKQKAEEKEEEKSFEITAPSFRAIGVISENYSCIKDPLECLKECENQQQANYLPSLLDKTELAFITQYASQNATHNFTQKDFDIKEMNGLFFTGLGVITHLKYYNVDKCPVDKGIDLIEYEHIINQGRDIFIRVARLGYNSKTGQRYKHVIEGKRKIETDPNNKFKAPLASFIELKQYCECIDKHITYTDSEVLDPKWKAKFNPITTAPIDSILSPINSVINKIDYKRSVFKELTVIEKKRIPIRCLYEDKIIENDVCKLQCLPWFWPTQEDSTKENMSGIEISYNDYLLCEYESKDWEEKSIKAKTPFMFLRASYLATNSFNDAYADYFKGDFFIKTNPKDTYVRDFNLIERRKTYFDNQVIAYTPSVQKVLKSQLQDLIRQQKGLKSSADISLNKLEINVIENKLSSIDASKSKTNIIETEFIEHYFNIKNIAAELNSGKLIGEIKYALFPQILRANVFIDHIRDLTQQKIASVVEYHADYIDHVFDEYKKAADPLILAPLGNGAKLILKNTIAFRDGKEEDINNTYKKISLALQAAKDKMGNLVTPDIIPDSISLEKLGITAPADIKRSIELGLTVLGKSDAKTSIQEIASFNPRELLRGKLSDVCGLDLTAILDELIPADSKLNQTPLFEINKIINKIQEELSTSKVYETIKKEIELVKKQITDYENEYKKIAKKINDYENELNKNLKKLSTFIPNTDELNNLIKSFFEKLSTQYFDISLADLPFEETIAKVNTTKANLESFWIQEKKLLHEEFTARQKELSEYFIKIEDEITNKLPIPEELQFIKSCISDITSIYAKGLDFPKEIELLFKSCIPSDLKDLPNVYCKIDAGKITFELTDQTKGVPLKVCNITFTNNIPSNIGFIQYQQLLKNLQTFITQNINGSPLQVAGAIEIQKYINTELNKKIAATDKKINAYFQEAVQEFQNDPVIGLTAIRKKIDLWKETAANLISSSVDHKVQDNIIKVRDMVLGVTQHIDFIKKADPFYYFSEQERLTKEILDTRARFQQEFYNLYIELEDTIMDMYQSYEEERAKYVVIIDELEKAKRTWMQLLLLLTLKTM